MAGSTKSWVPEDITLTFRSVPNWTGAGAGGGAGAEIASPEAIVIVVAMALTGKRAKPLVMTVLLSRHVSSFCGMRLVLEATTDAAPRQP